MYRTWQGMLDGYLHKYHTMVAQTNKDERIGGIVGLQEDFLKRFPKPHSLDQ